jgi:hypothetical protein
MQKLEKKIFNSKWMLYATAHKFMFTEEDTQTLYLQTSVLSPLNTKQSRGRRTYEQFHGEDVLLPSTIIHNVYINYNHSYCCCSNTGFNPNEQTIHHPLCPLYSAILPPNQGSERRSYLPQTILLTVATWCHPVLDINCP